MRSIKYVFGGNPMNLDDCLDLSLIEKPISVSLNLFANEIITEMYIFKRLIARFIWRFSNRDIQYDDIYGGIFVHESEKRQRRSLDNANCRLENRLNKIENLDIIVIGNEKKFNYSLIYK